VKSSQKPGAGLTYKDAGIKAIKQCGLTIADNLVWNIPLHIGMTEERTIQLLVSDLAYSDYSKLAGKLRNIRGVTYVFPREWEQGVPAIYDIKATATEDDITARFETIGLEVLRFKMNKIEVKKVKKSWWKK